MADLHCPECDSTELIAIESQGWYVNGKEYRSYGFLVKAHDRDAPTRCLDCSWEGVRADLEKGK